MISEIKHKTYKSGIGRFMKFYCLNNISVDLSNVELTAEHCVLVIYNSLCLESGSYCGNSFDL